MIKTFDRVKFAFGSSGDGYEHEALINQRARIDLGTLLYLVESRKLVLPTPEVQLIVSVRNRRWADIESDSDSSDSSGYHTEEDIRQGDPRL